MSVKGRGSGKRRGGRRKPWKGREGKDMSRASKGEENKIWERN